MSHATGDKGFLDQVQASPSDNKRSDAGAQAVAAFETTATVDLPSPKLPFSKDLAKNLPLPSPERLRESLTDTAFDPTQFLKEARSGTDKSSGTVLYLAYGSNLCAQTFQGKRGIKPISQINVVVPKLVLTFDLPGLPYTEPCFANTRYRDESGNGTGRDTEKSPLLGVKHIPKYHKDRWHKGLVGVVYEVTAKDFAHIIATEGGGSSYEDIVIDCYPLSAAETVPEQPDTLPFKAHTLFSPALRPAAPGQPTAKRSGRLQRPDTSYAQPSARYLKLITSGAVEHDLPREYMDYLYQLRSYHITNNKQRLGRFVMMAFWYPIIILMFTVIRMFPKKNGFAPPWLTEYAGAVFRAVWASYDQFFNPLFGDGERTAPLEDEEEEYRSEKTEDLSFIEHSGRIDHVDYKGIRQAV